MSIKEFSVEKEYEKNPQIKPSDVSLLREWLDRQPHLPKELITDLDLILAYHSSSRSGEMAKRIIDLNFSLRTRIPIYQLRTVESVEVALHAWLFAPLPGKSTNGNRIFVAHMLDIDPKKFVHIDIARAFGMVIDLWQYEEGTVDGVAIVVDMSRVSWSHITKTDLIISQQFFYFVQEAMFLRVKEFHFLNAPVFIDSLYNIYKQFVKKELLESIQIHQVGSDTVEKFIPKAALPKELGGSYKDAVTLRGSEAGTSAAKMIARLRISLFLHDIFNRDEMWNKIASNKQYFIDESRKRVDESRRPAESRAALNIEDIPGTFKKLEID